MVRLVEKEANLPWVEKYRPAKLEELVSHQEIIKTISHLISENRLPHLMFYGPPGTGKTSTILAAARSIYTPKQMQSLVLELNASDDRGINVVRQRIVDFAGSKGFHNFVGSNTQLNRKDDKSSLIKMIILDEADAMTKDAQNALRRVIEKYTETTRFCIICNYLSKIIPAIQSRCTRFRFAPLSKDQVMPRLNFIIKKEHLIATESGKEALFKLSNGDMRRVINVLQSTALACGEINEESVYKCVGQPNPALVKNMFQILLDNTFEVTYEKLHKICQDNGIALADILDEFMTLLINIDMPKNICAYLLDNLAQIECRLASGSSEKIQLLALISAFTQSRQLLFDNFES